MNPISTALDAPAPSRAKLVLGFLIIYIVWGSTYLAIRWGVATIPPFVLGAVRFLIAGAALYAFTRLRGAAAPTGLEWRNSAIIGALLLFVGNGAVSWASQRVPSSMASLLVATVPLWVVLCETVQGKRAGAPQWFGVAIGLVGVGLLVTPADGHWSSAAVDPIGAMVLVMGSLSWTIGSLFSRTAVLAKPAALAISMQMLVGGALLLLLSLISGELSHTQWGLVSTSSALSVLYLIVFGSLIGFSTYMWLLRVASPTAVGTYAYVNPLVAVLLGVWLAGERLPPQAFVAMLVIVGGVAMVSLGGRLQRRWTRRPIIES
jgi:drug/metabolite transporter (DMT)-like permease